MKMLRILKKKTFPREWKRVFFPSQEKEHCSEWVQPNIFRLNISNPAEFIFCLEDKKDASLNFVRFHFLYSTKIIPIQFFSSSSLFRISMLRGKTNVFSRKSWIFLIFPCKIVRKWIISLLPISSNFLFPSTVSPRQV